MLFNEYVTRNRQHFYVNVIQGRYSKVYCLGLYDLTLKGLGISDYSKETSEVNEHYTN